MTDYFSDRESGPRPRTADEVSEASWGGIVLAIRSRITDGSFGVHFPDTCDDPPYLAIGTNSIGLGLAARAEVPAVEWPLNVNRVPDPPAVMDLVEFCYSHVASPSPAGRYHDFFGHHHLDFDGPRGKTLFRTDINRMFSRNGTAYELQADGQVVRLAPTVLREALIGAQFHTGDAATDALLESARAKFLSPSLDTRKEGLERLWDSWERMKTLEPAPDKAASTKALLDRTASEPTLREAVENDARQLTKIGNDFRIRHFEASKAPISSSEQLDYFFCRLFALVHFVLRETGRCS